MRATRRRSFSLLGFLLIRLVHHRRAGTKVEKGRNHVLVQRKVGAGIYFQMAPRAYFLIPHSAAASALLRIISTLNLSIKRGLRFQFACANTPPLLSTYQFETN